ncbi:MAG: hypothetical protein OEZ02_12780 [Anaerolineae bacterium]|nr:hypothetical protein [Anaerolineae bacterium]
MLSGPSVNAHTIPAVQPGRWVKLHTDETFAAVLEHLKPLPPYAMLLGLCADGWPLIFDLLDHTLGSLAILGESAAGNTAALASMLASVVELNRPEDVNVHVITSRTEAFAGLLERRGFGRVYPVDDMASRILVEEFSKLAGERQAGMAVDRVQVLAIDGLAALLAGMDQGQVNALKWLLRVGPQTGIRLIIAHSGGEAPAGCRQCVDLCLTQINQASNPPAAAGRAGENPHVDPAPPVPNLGYVVRSGSDQRAIEILNPPNFESSI